MDYVSRATTVLERVAANPSVRHYWVTFKKHYKDADLWTYETGCLVFTSLIIYGFVLGGASGKSTLLDGVVTFLFILGTLVYIAISSLFRKLSRISEDNSVLELLKVTNKWIFTGLSFFPGIYFAFQYDEAILIFYKIIHLVTSCYFLYKRWKEFQLVPFLIGLGMSFALGSISPSIRIFFGLFGSGWFPTFCASALETTINTTMAICFMLRLPEKYLPSNMIFGLKVVKYLLFFFSWKTFFVIMIITSWKNIGAVVKTLIDVHFKRHTSDSGSGTAINSKLDNEAKKSK